VKSEDVGSGQSSDPSAKRWSEGADLWLGKAHFSSVCMG